MNREPPKDNQGIQSNAPAGSSALQRRVAVNHHQIDSRDLFVATKEVTIAHGGEMYRLRLTAQNKLILTK